MERLTIRTPKGAAVKMGEPANEAEARKMLMDNFHKVCEKLAHYEDLEESGRLVVLPEGYTIEGMAECANQRSLACPSDIGLPSPLHCNHTSCYKCWEAALKGGGQDE